MGQIQPIDIVAPCSWGLNTERENTLLPPQWATRALNAVINRSGRIAARRGMASQTTTAIAGPQTIDVLHEYLQEDGTSTIISTANNKVYKNITDFTDANNDITSSTAPTADHWQFVNFNNKVLGFQRGHIPIVWSGSGDFANASYSGTGPDGNCALAAFGRVWAADADKQTIRISALLDDTDYTTGSGGTTIDMSSLWTMGMDEVVALAALGATFIVFGKNHIVLWADGSGSEIGLAPANMYVVDTIEGTGCIARDSLAHTGEGDLIFLSRHGVQSLGRVIENKNNPVTSLTDNVRAEVLSTIALQRATDSQMDQVRAVHSPEEGIYVINFPVTGSQYVVDTHHPFQDDLGKASFPVLRWQLNGVYGLGTTVAGRLLFGTDTGEVCAYSGSSDNDVAYDWEAWTGWLDFGELNHRLKILKELIATVAIGTGSVVWSWEFDFSGVTQTRSVTYTGSGSAEYGIAEYGIAEYSGGVVLQRKTLPAHGEGQFLRLGATASINGYDVVLQQLSLAPKIGRMVT